MQIVVRIAFFGAVSIGQGADVDPNKRLTIQPPHDYSFFVCISDGTVLRASRPAAEGASFKLHISYSGTAVNRRLPLTADDWSAAASVEAGEGFVLAGNDLEYLTCGRVVVDLASFKEVSQAVTSPAPEGVKRDALAAAKKGLEMEEQLAVTLFTPEPVERIAYAIRAYRDYAVANFHIVSAALVAQPTGTGNRTPEAHLFEGLTIPEAAKKLLEREQRYLTNSELAEKLTRGGLITRADDPANTIGSVLKRRQEEVGDLVRINPGRGGKWGLADWAGKTPRISSAQQQ